MKACKRIKMGAPIFTNTNNLQWAYTYFMFSDEIV